MNTPEPCCHCRKSFYNIMEEDNRYASGWCDAGHEEFWGELDCPYMATGELDIEANAREREEAGKGSLYAINKTMEICHWINVFRQVPPGTNLDRYFPRGHRG